MVVLIRFPAQLKHVIANLGDHIITAHNRLLIVAGLDRIIVWVGNLTAIGTQQKELWLNPSFDAQPLFGGLGHQFVQNVAWRLINRFALHHTV